MGTAEDINAWIGSLAFNDFTPTEDMLGVAKTILLRYGVSSMAADIKPETVYLAVTGFFHAYCKHNPECETNENVRGVLNHLGSKLGSECGGQEEEVMMALKAIGNMGYAQSLVPTLNSCLND